MRGPRCERAGGRDHREDHAGRLLKAHQLRDCRGIARVGGEISLLGRSQVAQVGRRARVESLRPVSRKLRDRDRCHDPDDRHHHQEFDQCEPLLISFLQPPHPQHPPLPGVGSVNDVGPSPTDLALGFSARHIPVFTDAKPAPRDMGSANAYPSAEGRSGSEARLEPQMARRSGRGVVAGEPIASVSAAHRWALWRASNRAADKGRRGQDMSTVCCLAIRVDAAFLAGRCFVAYRKRGGVLSSAWPDFHLGE